MREQIPERASQKLDCALSTAASALELGGSRPTGWYDHTPLCSGQRNFSQTGSGAATVMAGLTSTQNNAHGA